MVSIKVSEVICVAGPVSVTNFTLLLMHSPFDSPQLLTRKHFLCKIQSSFMKNSVWDVNDEWRGVPQSVRQGFLPALKGFLVQ